jgi:ribonucleotide reductase beta subunit family protein with ferritin-like domain
MEPLFDASSVTLGERYTLFPIKPSEQGLMRLYKQAVASFWPVEEIDLSKDRQDWEKLTDNEQHFIKNILAFFAGSDGIVQENLAGKFQVEVQSPVARLFYGLQNAMEGIHCVAPYTKILTDKGYFNIVDCENTKVNVWNGTQFSEVTVLKTSESSRLYKVILNNGMELDCTDEHKWLIRTGNQNHPERCKEERIYTKDLKKGDILCDFEYPIIDIQDPDEFMNPYTHGFFCGDGSYTRNYPVIAIYDPSKKVLLDKLATSSYSISKKTGKIECYLTHKINKDKFFSPLNYSIDTKLKWLAGLFDADACVNKSDKGHTAIQYTSINYEFIKEVQLILSTLGCMSSIKCVRDKCFRNLPDGNGGTKEYECQPVYCLYITQFYVGKLVDIGFQPYRLALNADKELIQNKRHIKVLGVIDTQIDSPTYCFNEPIKHTGIFNGILTGQSETYSLLIDQYIKDPSEQTRLFRAIDTVPSIRKKALWALEWMNNQKSYAHRLLAFACVEGIFFSGAFCSIYYFKKRGLLPGLTFSNQLISRDEALHTEFAVEMYKLLEHKLNQDEALKIVEDAVQIETEFICDSLPCSLIGMNSRDMTSYIQFVADRLLVQLGYPKLYQAQNPFDFMELISLEGKSNFFEKKVGEYAKPGVGLSSESMQIKFDDDF